MKLILKGFSLIELTIVIALLGILGGISGLILDKAVRSSLLHTTLDTMHWEHRVALERMTKEISAARSNNAADLVMGANALTFINNEAQSITYDLNGSTLQRNNEDFVNNVSALNFDYLNASLGAIDPQVGNPTDVRYIRLQIEVTDDGNVNSAKTLIFPRSYQ